MGVRRAVAKHIVCLALSLTRSACASGANRGERLNSFSAVPRRLALEVYREAVRGNKLMNRI